MSGVFSTGTKFWTYEIFIISLSSDPSYGCKPVSYEGFSLIGTDDNNCFCVSADFLF